MKVLGNFFTSPTVAPQEVTHEFRSLSLAPPAPGRSSQGRLAPLHALAREFSDGTQEQDGRRWALRLLPKPLYRYESTDPKVVDGALFASVTSAGTDPEALLLEARTPPGASAPSWSYDLGRFTDHRLRVLYRGREVLSVPLMLGSTPPTDHYHGYWDRPLDRATGKALGQAP